MYVWLCVPFFFKYDKQSIVKICRAFRTEHFEPGQVIFERGEAATHFYVIISGQVSVLSDGVGVARKRDLYEVFGETALVSGRKTRMDTVTATKPTACLVLSYKDFKDKVYLFELEQRNSRLEFINSLKFSEGWSDEQKQNFNLEVKQKSVTQGKILFDLGNPAEMFYVVKSGLLAAEVELQLEETNKFPIGDYRWQQTTTHRRVEYQVHTFGPGEVLGL